jgi:hypothetical protein
MDETKAAAILSALANGVNPNTGEIFPAESPYQQLNVVRALFAALERFRRPRARARANAPMNAGKPWSEAEDRRLLGEFELGRSPAEIARELDRTVAGVEARLERHGRLSAQERTTRNRYPSI